MVCQKLTNHIIERRYLVVDLEVMWNNIRPSFEDNFSDAVLAVFKRHFLQLPVVLSYRLETLVTIEGLHQARLEFDEHLLASDFIDDLVAAELAHPSKPHLKGDKDKVRRSFKTRLDICISQLKAWIYELQSKWDDDDKYLKKDFPHWGREQQLLRHSGLSRELIEMHLNGELTYRKLIEKSPTSILCIFY